MNQPALASPLVRAAVAGPRPRTVAPEILDALDPADPAARASRRDLRWFNRLLGTRRWFLRQLRRHDIAPGTPLLEIGAGDGHLARSLHRAGYRVDALDRAPAPPGWPRSRRWHCRDVFQFTEWAAYPVVLVNLLLHHFEVPALQRLGRAFGDHSRLLLASETHRSRRAFTGFALACAVLRAHPVSRHDGAASIAAGFRDDELPRALGLAPARWHCRTSASWRGASRLVAVHRLP